MDAPAAAQLIPLHSALGTLDSVVGQYLLALAERGLGSPESAEVLSDLRQSWAQVQESRALAQEIHTGTGRPQLFVLDGGPYNAGETREHAAGAGGQDVG